MRCLQQRNSASRLGMIVKLTRVVNFINNETIFRLDTDKAGIGKFVWFPSFEAL